MNVFNLAFNNSEDFNRANLSMNFSLIKSIRIMRV